MRRRPVPAGQASRRGSPLSSAPSPAKVQKLSPTDISSPSQAGVVKPGQHPSPGQGNTPAGSRKGSRAVTPVADRPDVPAAAAILRTPPSEVPTSQQEPMAIDLTLSDDEEDAPAAPAQHAVASQAVHAAQPAVVAGTSPPCACPLCCTEHPAAPAQRWGLLNC